VNAKRVLLGGALAIALAGCDYIVVPEEEIDQTFGENHGWTGVATSVAPGENGDLRIELTIRNETGSWSAMHASQASLSGGASASCATVHVGTGGHRLAPGMHMRGYVGGTKAEPAVELIRVECAGAEPAPGTRLSVDYSYVVGEYNYYDPDARRASGNLQVELDEIAAGLAYPIAESFEGLVQPRDVAITALNDVVLTLADARPVDDGLELSWHAANPGEYPTFVHIGEPPLIGADGILYGFYQSPDLTSVPAAPPGGAADWTTVTTVPADGAGWFVLVSVESKKQRLFVNYAIDLSDA
jgi:hypothetical protein